MPAFQLTGIKVLEYVERFAEDDVLEAFYNVLERVLQAPYPGDDPLIRVMPLKESTMPNCFTVPFDPGSDGGGLIVYQVMKDFPVVRLLDAVWIGEPTEDSSA
jgi:hypothetical protein